MGLLSRKKDKVVAAAPPEEEISNLEEEEERQVIGEETIEENEEKTELQNRIKEIDRKQIALKEARVVAPSPPKEETEQNSEDIDYENVLKNHEARLQQIEAAFFRLKNI